MDDVHSLLFPSDTLPALGFALKSAIDDLEARAIVSETRGDDRRLGEDSAAEYRADIPRLLALVSQLDGFEASGPHPEGEALAWLGESYLIRDGQPLRLGATEAFEELLAIALRRSASGHISGVELASALARSTGESRDELIERARDQLLRLDHDSQGRKGDVLDHAPEPPTPSEIHPADDSRRSVS